MGSITAIFLIPFLSVFAIFSSLFAAIIGVDKTEVELPYNEEKGLVWTCEENAEWFFVEETEIEGDKQIFTFKGNSVFSSEYQRYYDREEVVFTAENNEQIIYMAVKFDEFATLNHIVTMYSPDEYGMITYTPKADTPVDGAVWFGGANADVYKTEVVDGETEYTFVYLPDEDGETAFTTYMIYAVKGEYGLHEYHERILLDVKLENGEATVTQKVREYYVDGKWTEDKSETQ